MSKILVVFPFYLEFNYKQSLINIHYISFTQNCFTVGLHKQLCTKYFFHFLYWITYITLQCWTWSGFRIAIQPDSAIQNRIRIGLDFEKAQPDQIWISKLRWSLQY